MNYALLVEDNEHHAILLERTLRKVKSAPSLEHVSDGQSALDFLSSKSSKTDLPSFMLLDLRLPSLSGFEVLRKVRQSPKLAEIPVIILSSSNLESDIKQAIEYGATAFWPKPVSTDTLQRYVDGLS